MNCTKTSRSILLLAALLLSSEIEAQQNKVDPKKPTTTAKKLDKKITEEEIKVNPCPGGYCLQLVAVRNNDASSNIVSVNCSTGQSFSVSGEASLGIVGAVAGGAGEVAGKIATDQNGAFGCVVLISVQAPTWDAKETKACTTVVIDEQADNESLVYISEGCGRDEDDPNKVICKKLVLVNSHNVSVFKTVGCPIEIPAK